MAIGLTPSTRAEAAPTMPAGFSLVTINTGFAPFELVNFAFLPSGDMLAIGKCGGIRRVTESGTSVPVATLPVQCGVVRAGIAGVVAGDRGGATAYDRCMAALVLTLIGNDRAGLVSAVAEVAARHDANWEQSQMAELAGRFAGVVLLTVPDAAADDLIADLEPLHGMLDITVQRGVTIATPADTRRFALDLVGADRRGIVFEISRVLAEHGVNIELFESESRDAPMSGERLFEAHAVLEIPRAADIAALRRSLERLADELMVDLDLEAADG